MKKRRYSNSQKLGQAPGTLVHVGEIKAEKVCLSLFRYDGEHISEQQAPGLQGLDLTPKENTMLWLNMYGLQDVKLMAEIGKKFNLHPLVLEDILNTQQRPKVDIYEDYLYLVARFFSYEQKKMLISSEQISIILGRNFVLSFQERPTGCFEPIRERLRTNKGLLRKAGPDGLAYALLDMVVDHYFVVLETVSEDCEQLEETLLRQPTEAVLKKIHILKRETMELRRAVWPLREIINSLIRNESGFFQATTTLYLRDVYDHTVHFIESLESLRDLLAGMMDIYLSSVSNRVNIEVRALTVVTMLFMPATLITGIFGMNFDVMPWLKDRQGFWWAIASMLIVAVSMGVIFWRRQYLSRR